ncbi:THO complex subunit 5 homolog [Planococcus citri]|uniref:THO complex subunit 5 homolog n=1 Tax=Planococcus citri TaxID=170843 RepID=UPI0031F807B8
MVKDTMDRHPKLKRGDSKIENIKLTNSDNSNVYHKAIEFEEQEALSRSGDGDYETFKQCCDKFREIIKSVGDIKSRSDGKQSDAVNSYRIDGSLLFVKMKKLNRLEKFRLNNARDKLYDTKREVDNLHLQWQNLLYETHHLKKEITKCLSFKSKDEHIELIPLDEFYKSAPQSISRPEITKKDRHQLRLARLEWELKQRKMLAETFHDLEKEKEQVALDIKKREDRIENLGPMIRNILTVTKPMQEHLSLPMPQIQVEPELAELLPHPLYFLSIQVDAMREACDSLLKIRIDGDKEAAARFNNNLSELTSFEESDSDEESQNHHHRRKTKKQIREEKKKKLLMKHPLTVNVQIFLKDKRSITIPFAYLINLRIVTVMPIVNIDSSLDGVCCRHLLEPRNILNGLFDQDYGSESPNAANNYQLQQLGLDFDIFSLGIPYAWAQKLCGLDFTRRTSNDNFIVDAKTNAAQRNLSITVAKIRRHFQTIVDLCDQLREIDKLRMPEKFRDVTSLPVKISCTLTKWSLLSWDQLNSYAHTKHLIPILNLSEYDCFFEAVFVRNGAKLVAVILLKPDYPDITPVFSLKIENSGVKLTAENDTNIKDMEKEVNLFVDELFDQLGKRKNWILTAQLYKLAVCFDIFLECTDSANFPREKLFLFNFRGRTRSLPFKFTKQGNEGLFVQR